MNVLAEQNELPLDLKTIFIDAKGNHSKSIEKRQRKMLAWLRPILPLLHSDEEIRLVITGCSPIPLLEQITMGWVVVYIRRCLLVVTNRRILHVPTNHKFGYRNSISEIPFSAVKSAKVKWATLELTYTSGKVEKFSALAWGERKRFKQLLSNIPLAQEGDEPAARHHLCPSCADDLANRPEKCQRCGLAFRNRDEARKMSWLIPGGGYFYTRHPWLGLSDAFTEVVLLVLAVVASVEAWEGNGSWLEAGFFTAILLVEKVITVYHANLFLDECIPDEKEVRVVAERKTQTPAN